MRLALSTALLFLGCGASAHAMGLRCTFSDPVTEKTAQLDFGRMSVKPPGEPPRAALMQFREMAEPRGLGIQAQYWIVQDDDAGLVAVDEPTAAESHVHTFSFDRKSKKFRLLDSDSRFGDLSAASGSCIETNP